MKPEERHAGKLDKIYDKVRFPDAIDWWAAYYAQDRFDVAVSNARMTDPVRQKIENRTWRRIVPEDGRVLDLACGRGYFSRRLQSQVGKGVTICGLDLAESILSAASTESRGISYVLGDAERLPFPEGCFDSVLCITSVEIVENPDSLIAESWRVLKPGGHLYLCLHKPFVDPLIIPTAVRLLYRFWQNRFGTRQAPLHVGYPGSLGELRARLRRKISAVGFRTVQAGSLLCQMEWGFYRKITPAMVRPLIGLCRLLNRLPVSYYKNLEYWLLKKP